MRLGTVFSTISAKLASLNPADKSASKTTPSSQQENPELAKLPKLPSFLGKNRFHGLLRQNKGDAGQQHHSNILNLSSRNITNRESISASGSDQQSRSPRQSFSGGESIRGVDLKSFARSAQKENVASSKNVDRPQSVASQTSGKLTPDQAKSLLEKFYKESVKDSEYANEARVAAKQKFLESYPDSGLSVKEIKAHLREISGKDGSLPAERPGSEYETTYNWEPDPSTSGSRFDLLAPDDDDAKGSVYSDYGSGIVSRSWNDLPEYQPAGNTRDNTRDNTKDVKKEPDKTQKKSTEFSVPVQDTASIPAATSLPSNQVQFLQDTYSRHLKETGSAAQARVRTAVDFIHKFPQDGYSSMFATLNTIQASYDKT